MPLVVKMTNTPAILIKNLSFSYEREQVLTNLNCKIEVGDYVGIVGHNGSGKSTLLKLILGILKPAKGKIYLFGRDNTNFIEWNKIGYVSQKAGLSAFHVPITVNEVVKMEKVSNQAVEEALKSVDMLEYKNSLLRELSGGQQQRVFIARALVKKPELLILDEPTVGVDVKTQETFYGLLERLNTKYSITLVLVSHDLHTISHQAKTVIQLDRKVYSYQTTTCNVNHIHKPYATTV
jgi:zinc transport system ATP-binding protein